MMFVVKNEMRSFSEFGTKAVISSSYIFSRWRIAVYRNEGGAIKRQSEGELEVSNANEDRFVSDFFFFAEDSDSEQTRTIKKRPLLRHP